MKALLILLLISTSAMADIKVYRSEEAVDLPPRHRERQAVDGVDGAAWAVVPLGQALDDQGLIHGDDHATE